MTHSVSSLRADTKSNKVLMAAVAPAASPEFLSAVPNITVAVGRSAVIPCVVKNLRDFKVIKENVPYVLSPLI